MSDPKPLPDGWQRFDTETPPANGQAVEYLAVDDQVITGGTYLAGPPPRWTLPTQDTLLRGTRGWRPAPAEGK